MLAMAMVEYKNSRLSTVIFQLTRSTICGNMCTAADNCQESICSVKDIRAELDGEVAGAGEGAGDGGAEVLIITIGIITKNRAPVFLGGGSVIDLHRLRFVVSIETFKCEGDGFSIS